MNIKEYFSSLFKGTHSLIKGMEVTGKELFTKKVTEQYPENRAELKIPERFRATLQFIYDDEGYHKCIACKTCERNCPNGTIQITTRMVDLPNGKKKMKLDKYIYDLGSCTFCGLCVTTCPTEAIEFSNDFEQAVFRREALVKQLNYLPEKEKPTPEAPAKPVAKPEAAKPAPEKTEPKVEAKPEPKEEVKPKVKEEAKPEPKVEEPKDEAPAEEPSGEVASKPEPDADVQSPNANKKEE